MSEGMIRFNKIDIFHFDFQIQSNMNYGKYAENNMFEII